MLSSGCGMAVTPSSSQQLWLPVQNVHIIKPVNILSCGGEELKKHHPVLRINGQLVAVEGSSVATSKAEVMKRL